MPRNRSESELAAAGVASVKLRLSADHKHRLKSLAAESGLSMSDFVEALVDREWSELAEVRGKKKAR